jgi:hypothetical protein
MPCKIETNQMIFVRHKDRMEQPTRPFIFKRKAAAEKPAAPLKTEDTGKMFEMAICLAYGIPYDGKYKYAMEKPESLKCRLLKLTELFPKPKHTAKKGSRYDFTALEGEGRHLSAKSTKKGVGKVAPQVVGQAQPKAFCETLGIPFTDVPQLKQYLQQNAESVLPALCAYTFDCATVYYNEELNTVRYITVKTPFEWSGRTYSWTCDATAWKNSSTLKMRHGDKDLPILEIQFHTKSRTNMAVRWCFENVLTVFKDCLEVVEI